MTRVWWLFAAALAVTLAGFWPSFFSNPALQDGAHIAHGALATGWMVLVIVQAWLMGRGRPPHRRLHRLIGWSSLVLFAALMATSLYMVHAMLADPKGLPRALRLTLAYIDLTSLPLMAGLYASALVWRRNRPLHARLMGSTVLVALIPALGRFFAIYVPGIAGLPGALHPSYWVVEAVLVALIVFDLLRRRRVYPAYPVTLAVFLAAEWTMFSLSGSGPFLALARALGLPPA